MDISPPISLFLDVQPLVALVVFPDRGFSDLAREPARVWWKKNVITRDCEIIIRRFIQIL